MWLGILFVVLGLVVVGIADVFGGVSYVTVTTLTDDRQLHNSREEDSRWIFIFTFENFSEFILLLDLYKLFNQWLLRPTCIY